MDGSRKFIIVSTGISILLIILVSVTLAYAGRDNTLMADKSLNLTINGFLVELPLSENGATYDAVSLSCVSENKFSLNNELGATVSIDGKKVGAGDTINLDLSSLSAENLITIKVENEKEQRVIYLRTLSSKLPTVTAAGESVYTSNYCATLSNGATGLYELDESGQIVYYIAASEESPENAIYSDFKKHILEDGKIRYSYQKINKETGLGERIVLDENHQYLKTIVLTESEEARDAEALTSDCFILIDDNHWIVASKQLQLVHNIPDGLNASAQGTKVLRVLIQEVKDDQILWEFTSNTYPELYGLAGSIYGNDTGSGIDYTGLNQMILDPEDDNLILSFSQMDTLLKLDRETGEILWKFSGSGDEFLLSAEQKLSQIESIASDNAGDLIITDQGQNGSRVVIVSLDEQNKTVKTYNSVDLSNSLAGNVVSATKVGDTLAIFGLTADQDSGGSITEFDFDSQKILLQMKLPAGYAFADVSKMESEQADTE
ncbi:MAG: aryl-sulfate sulfotransferase [Eubacteriaceae bacterium]